MKKILLGYLLLASVKGYTFKLEKGFLPIEDANVVEKPLEENRRRKGELLLPSFPTSDKPENKLPEVLLPSFKKDTFDIVKFGAKPGLRSNNASAINNAIQSCAEKGGGTVLIPEGLWITGPIVFKSNVNLHLKAGALIQFSDNFDDYPLIKTTYEGWEAYRCHAPIYAKDLENIAITGQGIFDGAGDAWRAVKKDKMTTSQWNKLINSGGVLNEKKTIWYPTEKALLGSTTEKAGVIRDGLQIKDLEPIKDFLRPNMVSITNCKKVLLEGVTFKNSPAWNVHPLLCDQITLRNLTIKNPWYGQNGDGLDLESCSNAVIENCSFDVGDDGICIKSGKDEQGRKRGRPTENVIVRNCTVYHGHGGFVIGSEMSGGVKNMFVSNCTFIGTDVGLRFKTTRGRGGVVENIHISDITMTNIAGDAILFDMFYGAKDPVPLSKDDVVVPDLNLYPVNEGTPQFKSFYIKNVICNGAERAIFIQGLPEMSIKDINLENISISSKKGFKCVEGENINLKNVTLLTEDKTTIELQNSKRIKLDQITYTPGNEFFLKVGGSKTESINIINTDLSKAGKDIELSKEVSKKTISKK